MYRVLIGGTFTKYNGTRRMGLARLNPDGTVDTSFMDTAYNQFAGLTKVYSFDVSGIVNVIKINGTDGGILLGGVFDEVGGGSGGTLAAGLLGQSSRATTVDVSNVAKLSGGETWGPGAVEFVEDTYTAAESGSSAFVTMRRKNGSLGTAGVRFKTHSIIGNIATHTLLNKCI